MERLMNVIETSEILNVSGSYVRQLAYSGRIPFVKLGKRMMFRPADLRDWLEVKVQETKVFFEVDGTGDSLI